MTAVFYLPHSGGNTIILFHQLYMYANKTVCIITLAGRVLCQARIPFCAKFFQKFPKLAKNILVASPRTLCAPSFLKSWIRPCVSQCHLYEGHMLHSDCYNPYSAGIDFRRHNLTSVDVRSGRPKSIPAL